MEISRDFNRIAFALVLLMVIHNFPLNNFCVLLAFLCWLRVPGADGSKAALTNLRYLRSYLAAIAESLLLAQLKAIRSSPCLAVLLDGSTDVSNEEHALIYLRYFDNITLLPLTCFLCAVKLPSKAGAVVDGVVRKVFQVLDLPFHKVVALSTDGDAAMIGQHNGLRAFFLKTNPWLISTHCAAHKTALIMADVSKRLPSSFRLTRFSDLSTTSLVAQARSKRLGSNMRGHVGAHASNSPSSIPPAGSHELIASWSCLPTSQSSSSF